MPLFEYRCNKCGHVTTFLEKAGSKGPHTCEQCDSRDTKKEFSTFAAPTVGSSLDAASCPTGTCSLPRST